MATIGLNEDLVNSIISDFNAQSATVLEELTEQFNNVLRSISDNWGTTDGVKHVEEKVVPAFQKTGEQVADTILQIGNTIKATAEKQASDTNNAVSINSPTKAQLGGLVNNMQDKLSNGYIGVYDTLESDVTKAQEKLGNQVLNKLEKLRDKVVDGCKQAFKDEASTVAKAAETYIQDVRNILDQGFTQVKTDIEALTKDATKYANDIQLAGLREASSMGMSSNIM